MGSHLEADIKTKQNQCVCIDCSRWLGSRQYNNEMLQRLAAWVHNTHTNTHRKTHCFHLLGSSREKYNSCVSWLGHKHMYTRWVQLLSLYISVFCLHMHLHTHINAHYWWSFSGWESTTQAQGGTGRSLFTSMSLSRSLTQAHTLYSSAALTQIVKWLWQHNSTTQAPLRRVNTQSERQATWAPAPLCHSAPPSPIDPSITASAH